MSLRISLVLTALFISGCTPMSSAWRTDYPKASYDVWTITSPDSKFHVTVLNEKSERAGGIKYACQYRFRHDDCLQDKVGTWSPTDGPGSASYPIFTRVLPIEEDVYLALGWTANSVPDVQLYAYLVRVKKNTMRVGVVSLYCEGVRLIVLADRLGLFVPDASRRDYPWEVSILGQGITPDDFNKASEPFTGRTGLWYARPALEGMDPGEGRVYWVDLKALATRLPHGTVTDTQ